MLRCFTSLFILFTLSYNQEKNVLISEHSIWVMGMKNKATCDRSVGMNIAKARVAANLTQEQFAAKLQTFDCDITRGTIAKLEIGIRHIRISELRAIAKVLNVSYEYLIDGLDNE